MGNEYVGFEVLTAVRMKMAVFWVVAPCRLVEVYGATTQKTAIFDNGYVSGRSSIETQSHPIATITMNMLYSFLTERLIVFHLFKK
jgi:hypothetical protein